MGVTPQKKIVLITGASGGLGQALCRIFSNGEYAIGIHVYRDLPAALETVNRLMSLGVESASFPADVRDSKVVQKMFEDLLTHWGQLDLLINNAGICRDDLFMRIDSAEWDEVIDTNLKGAFLCMREAGKVMQRQKGGHIINISSFASLTGRVGQASYAASKRGLIALTQSAAKEWGTDSIQVNTVFPGFLPTPMTADLNLIERERITQENVLGRHSTLEEVSEFIFHLSKAKYISGQTFNLDSRIG
jgi:3-oxoacyl-[acyl-carrier protein] reductase